MSKTLNVEEAFLCSMELMDLCVDMRNSGTPPKEMALALSTVIGMVINLGFHEIERPHIRDLVFKKIIEAYHLGVPIELRSRWKK